MSDMCKTIEDMLKVERTETRLVDIAAIMKNLSVSAEKAMELLNVPAGERETLSKMLPAT